MVFHKSLSDNKSLQVSRTFLSILDDLHNAVVWMVSIRLVNSKSSCPCTNPLVKVSRAPIAIGIIVTLIFHSFFSSLPRSRYLSFFFFFQFYFVVSRECKVDNFASSLFWLIIIMSGRLTEIRWLLLLYTPLEFFPSVLADGFSLEFEWQQVSSSLQDSSQYSRRSQ